MKNLSAINEGKDIVTKEYTEYDIVYDPNEEEATQQVPLSIVNLIYPVGSIYMNTNAIDPTLIFTGTTWERIQDTFLLAAGSSYTAGSTGGEETVTLTIDQMPSHSHSYRLAYGGLSGAHGLGYGDSVAGDFSGLVYNTGGDQPHNNMPPYLAVYMWRRVS